MSTNIQYDVHSFTKQGPLNAKLANSESSSSFSPNVNELLQFATKCRQTLTREKPSKQVFTILHELDLNLKQLAGSVHDTVVKNANTAASDVSISSASEENLFENIDMDNVEFFKEFPDWEVERELGRGACGIVYAAEHPETHEILFAIKKTALNLNPAVYYYAVIKVFKLMSHKNIIKYYGCDICENEIFLFLEYCNQGSVYDAIYKTPDALNPDIGPGIKDPVLVQQYITQTLEALVYLHGHDIVHRDLKPANLLLHNGALKLADFGAAKLWYKSSDKQLTGNSMSGSPCYLAPEVITDTQELGPKGARDIWAVGCLLYEMVLGREPWDQLDNIWSLYYLIGVWAQRTREMKSEIEPNAPFQMLRGCKVCDKFESDDESQFSESDDDETSEDEEDEESLSSSGEIGANPAPRIMRDFIESQIDYEPPHLIGPCGIMDINCIRTAKEISNPLLTLAVKSNKFSEDALDFLNLTLQWTPENRPSASDLLGHPYIKKRNI